MVIGPMVTPDFDVVRHRTNRESCFTAERLAPYYGLHVAHNLEGTEIVASGRGYDELEKALAAAGIDPSSTVLSYVPAPDEIFGL